MEFTLGVVCADADIGAATNLVAEDLATSVANTKIKNRRAFSSKRLTQRLWSDQQLGYLSRIEVCPQKETTVKN